MSKSNGSTGSQTGSGYSTDVSDDNLPHDAISPASDVNEHSDSDDQVTDKEMLAMWQQNTSLPQIFFLMFKNLYQIWFTQNMDFGVLWV